MIVQQKNAGRKGGSRARFLPNSWPRIGEPVEDLGLWEEQLALSEILENAPSLAVAQRLLASSRLARTDWAIESWRPEMLETARQIAQKWRK